jgi:hypothetical protein
MLYVLGAPAWAAYAAMIVAAVAAHAARVWCLRRYYAGFDLAAYVRGFLLPATAVLAVVTAALYAVHLHVDDRLLRLGVQLLTSLVLTIGLAWAIGLGTSERAFLKRFVQSRWRPAVAGGRT